MFHQIAACADGTSTSTVQAVICERGATLRSLVVHGVELIRSTMDLDVPFSAGQVLVPWPNRIAGARWTHKGTAQYLAVTEPALGNALHGLIPNYDYAVKELGDDRLFLSAPIKGHEGYPFELDTSITFTLTERGIRFDHAIMNAGPEPAPVALGLHPYVRYGDHDISKMTLRIAASDILPLNEVYLPGPARPASGEAEDLRNGQIARLAIDHACFTGLESSALGRFQHDLLVDATADRGERGVRVWADHNFGYVQIYRTSEFPHPTSASGTTTALAIEPMTAPPNSLNSGVGLVWLEPGQKWDLSWGIERIDA